MVGMGVCWGGEDCRKLIRESGGNEQEKGKEPTNEGVGKWPPWVSESESPGHEVPVQGTLLYLWLGRSSLYSSHKEQQSSGY